LTAGVVSIKARVNRRLLLAARPEGLPRPEHWRLERAELEPLEDGRFRARTLCISLDPAMRGWMDDRPSYVRPVRIGEVMRANTLVEVVESRHPAYAEGELLAGAFGVQEQVVSAGARGIERVPAGPGDPRMALHLLGLSGLTAYFGVLEVVRPRSGETVLVSGAAGAVGSVAGQLARLHGCRVIGIAGGEAKARHAREELGFHAVIDHRAEDVPARLRELAPDGIDAYFDNVGGPLQETVLGQLATGGRIVICGAVASYNGEQPGAGLDSTWPLLVKRARIEGFLVTDFHERFGAARDALARWHAEGALKAPQTVIHGGLEDFPRALADVFTTDAVGKRLFVLDRAPGES